MWRGTGGRTPYHDRLGYRTGLKLGLGRSQTLSNAPGVIMHHARCSIVSSHDRLHGR